MKMHATLTKFYVFWLIFSEYQIDISLLL